MVALADGEPLGCRALGDEPVSHQNLADMPLPRRAAGDVVFRISRTIEQMRRHEDDLMVQLVHEADSDIRDTHVDTQNQFAGLGAELFA